MSRQPGSQAPPGLKDGPLQGLKVVEICSTIARCASS